MRVSVPVRGGSADRSDAVVLGVSQPPLHRHALSFGELVPPHTHTHTYTTALNIQAQRRIHNSYVSLVKLSS